MTYDKRRHVAATLLNRKHGATVDQLVSRTGADERKVRSLIDNLRRAGKQIVNTAPRRFKLVHMD
jgi:transcription initiation factor IIE alpha subunit